MVQREHRDPEDEGIAPVDEDHPLASWDRVTAAEQRQGETLRERVAREQPEIWREGEDERQTPGRFYEQTDDGTDIYKEAVGWGTDDRGALSPEEAAMREVEDPEAEEIDETGD